MPSLVLKTKNSTEKNCYFTFGHCLFPALLILKSKFIWYSALVELLGIYLILINTLDHPHLFM